MRQRLFKISVAALMLVLVLGLCACKSTEAKWQEQYDLGMKYVSEGNYEEAIIAFAAAIEIDPNNADAYIGRADAYVVWADTERSGDEITDEIMDWYQLAEADYLSVLEAEPENAEIYKKLFELYRNTGDMDKAANILQEGIDACGSDEELLRLAEELGYELDESGRLVSEEEKLAAMTPSEQVEYYLDKEEAGQFLFPENITLFGQDIHEMTLEDVLAAVRLLRERGYRRIYLAGDSAGGNLAASAAWKERSGIAGAILYYPVVLAKNDRSESWRKYGKGFGLDGSLMEAFNESYAPGVLADDPVVSPLLAKEFSLYPETLIVAAECDVLHDQGKAFAELLKTNGIPVTHRTLPGTIHAFLTYPGMGNAYQKGVRLAAEFLKKKEAQMKNCITPESIVRISRIEVDPAQLPEYLALVTECGRESMVKEPGVYMMYSMQEKAHPERITILEIYADRAAYEHHVQTPHFQKYKQTTLKMVRQLDLLDQNPLVPEMRMK